MRVEVLDREEIEEKLLMTPGDIVMMLNEMGGMRVQATSPSLGAASVRVQGMRGRYTRFLSDGLPLFGEQVGSLGLLQIPPMDLGQVEVIKGVASSLYGAGAMGGVVNLVSRRPGPEVEREFLGNRSTRGATDAVFWYSSPVSREWSTSLLASAHGQERADVDDDGWADLPGYSRGVVRSRFFFDDKAGRSFFITAGTTVENRSGGTMPNATGASTGAPREEALDTRRFDAGAVSQEIINDTYVLSGRTSFTTQSHEHRFGAQLERDRHDTAFGEITVRRAIGRQTWVAGAAIEYDGYRPRDLPEFAYEFLVPGLFVQDDFAAAGWLTLSASSRMDVHSEYGTFFSPRFSALLRRDQWSSRLSVGAGFFPSTLLTEETEAAGLSKLTMPRALKAERGRSGSVDLSWSEGTLSGTVTLFASRIDDPLVANRGDRYTLENLSDPTRNTGLELLGTWRQPPFALTATYTYVRALQEFGSQTLDVPLTPRHSAGLVGMWEREDTGRVGLEWYNTGVQQLEANPYRSASRPYMIVGVLVERKLGKLRVFVNGENLTDVRQTKWDPLVRPVRGADGRWAVDGWAPLDGRTINGGVRIEF